MHKTKKRFITWPRLVILALIGLLAVMGLWLVVRNALVKGLVQGVQSMERDGYQIEHGGLSVSGFPFSISASSQNISIKAPSGTPSDPSKNWAIKAEQVELKTATLTPLSWDIHHGGKIRVDMRGPRGERYMFDANPANVEARIQASIKGHLKSAQIDVGHTELDALIGTPPFVSKLQAFGAKLTVHGNMGELEAHTKGILLSPKTPDLVDKALGRKISTLDLTVKIDQWRGLERQGVQMWMKGDGHIKASTWHLVWGEADIVGDFDFVFKNSFPDGTIHIRIKHADSLIDKFADSGLIPSKDSQKIKGFLSLIEPGKDGRQLIELTIRDGILRYGFIPLGNLRH